MRIKDGMSYSPQISVRQLLTHTSGIKDTALDDANGTAANYGRAAPGSYAGRLTDALEEHLPCLEDGGCDTSSLVTTKDWAAWDPSRSFDQEAGVLNWFLNSNMAASPLHRPGVAFHYSDTGHVILGLIVEKLSGRDLHAALRRRIFDRVGMWSTYLAYANDPDPSPWRHAVADLSIGDVPATAIGLNVSFDRGGGGVVSTAGDLNVFLQALMRGELFRQPETLRAMTDFRGYPGLEASRTGVGLGVFRERTPFGVVWGHPGAWGAKMYYAPEAGLYLTGTVNQQEGVSKQWWWNALEAMHEAGYSVTRRCDETGPSGTHSPVEKATVEA